MLKLTQQSKRPRANAHGEPAQTCGAQPCDERRRTSGPNTQQSVRARRGRSATAAEAERTASGHRSWACRQLDCRSLNETAWRAAGSVQRKTRRDAKMEQGWHLMQHATGYSGTGPQPPPASSFSGTPPPAPCARARAAAHALPPHLCLKPLQPNRRSCHRRVTTTTSAVNPT